MLTAPRGLFGQAAEEISVDSCRFVVACFMDTDLERTFVPEQSWLRRAILVSLSNVHHLGKEAD